MMRATFVALACLGAVFASADRSWGGVIFNVTESGNDVVITADGSLNTTALDTSLGSFFFSGSGGLADFGSAANSSQGLGMQGGGYTLWSGATFSGPGYPFAETSDPFSSSSGDPIGVGYTQNSGGRVGVFLPSSYTSGASISSTGTWTSTDFSDLGVVDGNSFTWTWGTGASADFLTVNVGSAASSVTAVPEPASIALFGMGIGSIAGFGAFRRKKSAAETDRETNEPDASA